MEYQKITNLLGNIPDNIAKFIPQQWQKFMINLEGHTVLTSR